MSEDTLSGKGRSQQLGRMGEYAVMAQLLSKSWVTNVYSPAADTGVDLILLTKDQKLRKLQVKTSRIYPNGETWFMNIFQQKLREDITQPDMFYVLAEGASAKALPCFSRERACRVVSTTVHWNLPR